MIRPPNYHPIGNTAAPQECDNMLTVSTRAMDAIRRRQGLRAVQMLPAEQARRRETTCQRCGDIGRRRDDGRVLCDHCAAFGARWERRDNTVRMRRHAITRRQSS